MELDLVIWDVLFIVGLVVLVVLMVLQEIRFNRRLKAQREESIAALNVLDEQLLASQRKVQQLSDDLGEYRSGVLGVGKQIRSMETEIQRLQAKQQDLDERDPEAKMYRKAGKLVESGASVEEIMQACELPRAEAELLISLHNSGKT